MGIAIVCMVKPPNDTAAIDSDLNQTVVDECPGLEVDSYDPDSKPPVSFHRK